MISVSDFIKAKAKSRHNDDSDIKAKFLMFGFKVVNKSIRAGHQSKVKKGVTLMTSDFIRRGTNIHKMGDEPIYVLISAIQRPKLAMCLYPHVLAKMRRTQKYDVARFITRQQIMNLVRKE